MIRFWAGSILGFRHLGLLALVSFAKAALLKIILAHSINFDVRKELGVRGGGNALADGHFER